MVRAECWERGDTISVRDASMGPQGWGALRALCSYRGRWPLDPQLTRVAAPVPSPGREPPVVTFIRPVMGAEWQGLERCAGWWLLGSRDFEWQVPDCRVGTQTGCGDRGQSIQPRWMPDRCLVLPQSTVSVSSLFATRESRDNSERHGADCFWWVLSKGALAQACAVIFVVQPHAQGKGPLTHISKISSPGAQQRRLGAN